MMINIGSKISMLRKSHNMTQQELADKLHISNKVVSKWELGASEPDLNTLANIAEIFNISIGELLGDTTPAPAAAKGDLNTRGYNFFRRNYMTIIQLILIWAALIVAVIGFGYLAGYDLVLDILPTHLIWGSIGLTIGIALIQVFLTLIRPGHKAITILKSVLILALFALALSCYFYLGYTGEQVQEFFIVAAISYTIFFIVSILHLLLDLKVINAPAPFKLGKILFILVIVFTSIQCGAVLGQIANTAVGFYDLRTPNYVEITSRHIVFNRIGEQTVLKTEYPDFTRHDPFTFASTNPEIATVDKNGVVTATGYGYTYINTVVNGHRGSLIEVYVNKPNFNISTSSGSHYGSLSMYAHKPTTFSINAGEYFDTLADFKNNFTLECTKPYSLISESFADNKYTVTVQLDSEYGSTKYEANFYIKSVLSNQQWDILTVFVQDTYQINANNITTRAGMYFDVDFTTYPTSITNYDYEILYDPEFIIEDNGRYVAIAEGTTEMTIQLDNGLSKTISVTTNGTTTVTFYNDYIDTIYFYHNNVDNLLFKMPTGAYNIPITAKIESDIENFANLEFVSYDTGNNSARYNLNVNSLGEGYVTFCTPWNEIGRYYINSIHALEIPYTTIYKTHVNYFDIEFNYDGWNATNNVTLTIADPTIAYFYGANLNETTSASQLSARLSEGTNTVKIVGVKVGSTEITVTSNDTGEIVTSTLEVVGITSLTCNATEAERTVAPGETKAIRFDMSPSQVSFGSYWWYPTTLYEELTVTCSNPNILSVQIIDPVTQYVGEDYGQLEIIASEIEGERAEVVVTISSPEGVKVDIPIIITNDTATTE